MRSAVQAESCNADQPSRMLPCKICSHSFAALQALVFLPRLKMDATRRIINTLPHPAL